ncbi:hypothetical protein [Mucilaginibacter hurinus]|nr:hypothetical protein [Mucilaginibacter hurinus]
MIQHTSDPNEALAERSKEIASYLATTFLQLRFANYKPAGL